MKKYIISVFTLLFAFASFSAKAYFVPKDAGKKKENKISYREDCQPASQQKDMEINNIRVRLLNGGDMFWDLSNGRYIAPKVEPGSGEPEVSAIFAGGVWIGGFDESTDNLVLAAVDYRSGGETDFYPGPLSDEDGTITQLTCEQWDIFFNVTGAEIDEHLELFENRDNVPYTKANIPDGVKYWPALGNDCFEERYNFPLPVARQGLGNYFDANSNGFYDPLGGDYPVIDIRGCVEPQYPDDMWFWIYNDNGNAHTLTGATPIFMEVQVQAFAYATQDEINDMTFYRYKLINRAQSPIRDCYFANWVDPDLGCSEDDFIGCDTAQALMYVYNEDELDGENNGCSCNVFGEIINTYCDEVPLLGVDYFRGPLSEPRNGVVRELGMTSFTYYNREGLDAQTDPQTPTQYYNYLTGLWKDGTPYSYGGDGYDLNSNNTIRYAFTDSPDDANGWSMCTANLPRGDRRTLQASGPLRLLPGAINELIVGVVFVPDVAYPCPSINRLIRADLTAQGLFDNCFDIIDGPDAPTLEIIELDQEVIFTLVNQVGSSNNYGLSYSEVSPDIPNVPDSTYVFEGYLVYQLVDASASASDIGNDAKARLVLQADLRNGINKLYNWEPIENVGGGSADAIWTYTLEVDGQDNGIVHSFNVTKDAFASGDNDLINFKKYYYTAIAYATNNFEQFDPDQPELGQDRTYIEGRANVRRYTVVPHKTLHVNLNTQYGDSDIRVFGLDGQGASERFTDLKESIKIDIIKNGPGVELEWDEGQAPIGVKIYNPVEVVDGTYYLEFNDYVSGGPDTTKFTVRREGDATTFFSEVGVETLNEHLINEFGFSVSLGNSTLPGEDPQGLNGNGFIGYEFEYKDPRGPQWYTPALAQQGQMIDFIRLDPDPKTRVVDWDANLVYATENASGIYPYAMCSSDLNPDSTTLGPFPFIVSPTWLDRFQNPIVQNAIQLNTLENVDIVFTSDKSLWSRCVIVSTGNTAWYNTSFEDTKRNMDLMEKDGVTAFDMDGDGLPDPEDPDNEDLIGMGYFPGYAMNPVTGERLNIFWGDNPYFSEDFFDVVDLDEIDQDRVLVGGDMLFNPTYMNSIRGDTFNQVGIAAGFWPIGGQHEIFVTNTTYDSCKQIREKLYAGNKSNILNPINKKLVFTDVMWSGIIQPLVDFEPLGAGNEGLVPNDLTIKLRVNEKYEPFTVTDQNDGNNSYKIIIEGKQAEALDQAEVDDKLDLINVVPNPYYAYSQYENNSAENRVKITNLPPNCEVSIFSLDGRFIQKYVRNLEAENTTYANAPIEQRLPNTDLEWDLTNIQGVPVAPGLYYIHINAPGMGERIIKWYGINRAFDPSGL